VAPAWHGGPGGQSSTTPTPPGEAVGVQRRDPSSPPRQPIAAHQQLKRLSAVPARRLRAFGASASASAVALRLRGLPLPPAPRRAKPSGAHLTRAGGAERGGAAGLTWPAAWGGRDSSVARRVGWGRARRPPRCAGPSSAATLARPRTLAVRADAVSGRSRWKRS
jgi:hypothetical protein